MRLTLLVFLCAIVATAADKPKLPDGPGKATMERVCGSCHGAEIVLGKKLTRDGWSQIVVNMIQRGAQGSDDEFAEIVDYLTNTLSKINVNQATAQQRNSQRVEIARSGIALIRLQFRLIGLALKAFYFNTAPAARARERKR